MQTFSLNLTPDVVVLTTASATNDDKVSIVMIIGFRCMQQFQLITWIFARIFQPGYFCQGFAPVVDGEIIPDEPIKLRRRGEFMKTKIMAGHCKDDGSLYTVACKLSTSIHETVSPI